MDDLISGSRTKSFSYKGYLSSHAYFPKTESELFHFANQHTCPCCRGHLTLNTEHWRESLQDQDGRKLLSLHCLCFCGFSVPFFAVVNYLFDPYSNFMIRDDNQDVPILYPSSSEASLFECRFLIHIGKYDLALNFLESPQAIAIDRCDAAFFKAFCHEQLTHLDQALRHYDQCLDLCPDHGEAWYNKWRILKSLGHVAEAEFHKVKYKRYSLTNENTLPLKRRHMDFEILAQGSGQHGKVQVLEAEQQRSLYINQELQSSLWLENGQPSKIPSNPDGYGMLLNGCHFQADHHHTDGLILGLGAGAGVLALLHNFSQLTLTVVELDPIIIHMATRHFPALLEFAESGRLILVCEDAYHYVERLNRRFDFIVADLYQGNFEPCPRLFDLSFFDQVKSKSDLFSVNLKHPESHFERSSLIHYFSWPSIGLNTVFNLESNYIAGYEIYHTVLFNKAIAHIEDFVPYKDEETYLAKAFRRDFNARIRQESDR